MLRTWSENLPFEKLSLLLKVLVNDNEKFEGNRLFYCLALVVLVTCCPEQACVTIELTIDGILLENKEVLLSESY
jgi:hypothetical protein